MNKYPNAPLGQICNIEIGRTPSRNQPKYWGNGYSWLSIADMKNFKFISETKEQVTDLAIGECNMKLVSQGTLLFSFKLSVGKVGIASKDLFTNEAIAALKIKSEKEVYQPFLYHALGSLNFDGKGDRAVKGITLNKAKLKELLIPLPPLPQQKRIAEILDKADDLRQKNKQLLAAYDELLQATFLDMFGDPVKNPKGWDCKRISDIGTSRLGKMLDRKTIVGENLKPYLRNSNVSWFEFKLDDLLEMDFNEKDKIEFSLKNGDVLMCEGGEIGRCAIWRDNLKECYFQKAIHRIRLNDKYALPEFFVFMFWLYTKKGGLNKFLGAATILHLTGVNLKKMELPIPPIALQYQFAQIVENIDAQKALVKQSLKESEDLFNGLVQKAFGGEL